MVLQAMQRVLAVASIVAATASLSASNHQSAAHQSQPHDIGMIEASFSDFVKAKQIQKRRAYFHDIKQDISQSQPEQMTPRHQISLNAFGSHLDQQAQVEQPVPYIPKIGVGNVTTPTELPPPPPTLNPDHDMQPFDTRIGNFIASSFLAPPTVTPPPTQAALDLAFGCPEILGYPNTVQLGAPTDCNAWKNSRAGNFTASTGAMVLSWEEICDVRESMLPFVKYTHIDGQVLFHSKTRFSFFGSTMEILDCDPTNIRYTLEEKVYHQTSFVDQEVCKKYGSCDGTVFLQYFMKNRQGKVVAETPYLTLFQNTFTVAEPGTGIAIAEVSRVGDWSPKDTCPKWDRLWSIKYATAPPAPFGEPKDRWPIAVMVNMLTLRDSDRRKNGMVTPSKCEIINVSVVSVGLLLLFILCLVLSLIFYYYMLSKAKLFFYNIEVSFFPHTMYKPSKYEG